jgi:hypothetical protein
MHTALTLTLSRRERGRGYATLSVLNGLVEWEPGVAACAALRSNPGLASISPSGLRQAKHWQGQWHARKGTGICNTFSVERIGGIGTRGSRVCCASRQPRAGFHKPFGLEMREALAGPVARTQQPRAGFHKPFGLEMREALAGPVARTQQPRAGFHKPVGLEMSKAKQHAHSNPGLPSISPLGLR